MRRTFFVLFVLFALAMAVLAPVTAAGAAQPETGLNLASQGSDVAKSSTGSYIVVMAIEPLLADFDQDQLNTSKAKKEANGLRKGQDKALKDAGVSTSSKVNSYVNAVNGFSAIMSHADAIAVANQKDVAFVMPDELYQPTTDSSPQFIGLSDPAGAWQTGYDGEGVVVGIIDTGIWPEHPSFADDGSYSAPSIAPLDGSIYATCDFGNDAHNSADDDFTCNNKLVGARQILPTYRALIGAASDEFDSARDDDGHGTHTASTTAGNAGVQASIFGIDRGVVTGIAPRAQIIAYKGLGEQGGFGSDLAAAIDQAVADGVDVINYSIGGGPSLGGADDIAFLFAADAGIFVAVSNGNNGPGAGTGGGPASVPWVTSVGASTQSRTFEGSASSSDGWEFFGASITESTGELPLVDAADAGDELCNIGSLDPSVVNGKIVLCKRGAIARADKSHAVFDAGGAGMILYNANDAQSEVTDNHWVPSVHINNTDGQVIKDYIATASAPVAQINGGVFTPSQGSVMADFSSRGPNVVALDIIKPDVTAPGVNILAGASPMPYDGLPGDGGQPRLGQLFQSISGTSMSGPHVAGVFALMKQAHPDWSPAAAKSALMTTARQDVVKEDGTTPADPFDMGAGYIAPGERVHKGSAFQPGLVYDSGFFEYLGFMCDADSSIFANAAATCGFLDSIGVPTTSENLNYPSIGVSEVPGSVTVTRTVTSVAESNGWRTYKPTVEAPPGFNVSVSPSSFRLKPGQSATFEVTFTNVSAPIGAWRFGSLTWTDNTGRYSVYSPLAARGTLFSSPESVSGSGVNGSTSLPITFGYTGAYAAAPHGLTAATVNDDNVVQDPDQSFDPTDGFSNSYVINVADAAYLKVAIPADAVNDPAIDLDVFVYGPSGTLVGSSTNGGTDESVAFENPADGAWTVWVHGWQTAGASADYTMYSWVVPNASGGNLSIDSAPASAVIGTSGSVDISWTGASAGSWHLGAVSHSDAGGVFGLTLVEVDNR